MGSKGLEAKKEKVAELKEAIDGAVAVVLTDYRGLGVEAIGELRRRFDEENVKYRVVKNSLMRRALQGTQFEGLEDYLVGPIAAAWTFDDEVAPARVAARFAKDYQVLEMKGGWVDGRIVGPEALTRLASLPSKEELLRQVVTGLCAPLRGLAFALSAPVRDLTYAVSALKTKREGAQT